VADKSGTEKIKGIFNWQGMTMADNQKHNWQNVTLKSLGRQLRRLRQVQVPQTLKAKLLAAIPDRPAKAAPYHHVQWRPQAWDFGVTAAAAVLIFALICTVNYGLSVPSQVLLTKINDTSLCYPGPDLNSFLDDQNNTLIEDTNYINYNGRR